MSAKPKARAKRRRLTPTVGDYVLIGSYGRTMPSDWFIAAVLWTEGEEMLTRHAAPSNGEIVTQVLRVDQVLAIGSIHELGEFKRDCAYEVIDLSRRVRRAEIALGRARNAVWDRLDQYAARGTGERA